MATGRPLSRTTTTMYPVHPTSRASAATASPFAIFFTMVANTTHRVLHVTYYLFRSAAPPAPVTQLILSGLGTDWRYAGADCGGRGAAGRDGQAWAQRCRVRGRGGAQRR